VDVPAASMFETEEKAAKERKVNGAEKLRMKIGNFP
jgi:hypothetical protein